MTEHDPTAAIAAQLAEQRERLAAADAREQAHHEALTGRLNELSRLVQDAVRDEAPILATVNRLEEAVATLTAKLAEVVPHRPGQPLQRGRGQADRIPGPLVSARVSRKRVSSSSPLTSAASRRCSATTSAKPGSSTGSAPDCSPSSARGCTTDSRPLLESTTERQITSHSRNLAIVAESYEDRTVGAGADLLRCGNAARA